MQWSNGVVPGIHKQLSIGARQSDGVTLHGDTTSGLISVI